MEQGPIEDNDKAYDEDGEGPVDTLLPTDLDDDGDALHPGFPRGDAKHRDQRPRKISKRVMRAFIVEEGGGENGVDGHDYRHDEKGIQHRQKRGHESIDDASQRLQTAEYPEYTEGPECAQSRHRHVVAVARNDGGE